MSISWSGNATTIFSFAKWAVGKIVEDKPTERQGGQGFALVAIVFSAMALEAFINEMADIAGFPVPPEGYPPQHPSVPMVADVLKEVVDSYGSVQTKYLLAKRILAGQPYDKGARPYQDFHLLVELRNTLIHIKHLDMTKHTPEGVEQSNEPSIIKKLASKSILAEPGTPNLWIIRITTLETARWACNTAAAMVHSLIDVIPDPNFKEQIGRGYGEHFSEVGLPRDHS